MRSVCGKTFRAHRATKPAILDSSSFALAAEKAQKRSHEASTEVSGAVAGGVVAAAVGCCAVAAAEL